MTAKEAEASAIEKRMTAEAHGLAQKAEAMRALEGAAKDHEEFRLKLANQREIALEQIKARVAMSESQAKVMAEAMGKADIKIVGGDGQFFDRFVKAVSLGNSIDGVVDNSEVVRKALGDRLDNGKLLQDVKDVVASIGHSSEEIKNLTVTGLLGNLMLRADATTRPKLQTLLEQARKLGIEDAKVS